MSFLSGLTDNNSNTIMFAKHSIKFKALSKPFSDYNEGNTIKEYPLEVNPCSHESHEPRRDDGGFVSHR